MQDCVPPIALSAILRHSTGDREGKRLNAGQDWNEGRLLCIIVRQIVCVCVCFCHGMCARVGARVPVCWCL